MNRWLFFVLLPLVLQACALRSEQSLYEVKMMAGDVRDATGTQTKDAKCY